MNAIAIASGSSIDSGWPAGSARAALRMPPSIKTCAVVEAGQRDFRQLLARLIERDRELGALPAQTDVEAMAAVIATYSEGLSRSALVAYDRARFERETELFLSSLGL